MTVGLLGDRLWGRGGLTLPIARPWATTEPGRLVGRGHPAGDFLEAWAWDVIEEDDGYVRVSAHLPDHVLNLRGQLFGGFRPTYVDLIALFTVNSRARRASPSGPRWLATTSMRVGYFEPVVGPRFIIDSRRVKQRGRTHVVLTRFLQDGELAVLAATTMREISRGRSLGDL
jgi:acyl-coenzyme A thioesterase PaaI-like protein